MLSQTLSKNDIWSKQAEMNNVLGFNKWFRNMKLFTYSLIYYPAVYNMTLIISLIHSAQLYIVSIAFINMFFFFSADINIKHEFQELRFLTDSFSHLIFISNPFKEMKNSNKNEKENARWKKILFIADIVSSIQYDTFYKD